MGALVVAMCGCGGTGQVPNADGGDSLPACPDSYEQRLTVEDDALDGQDPAGLFDVVASSSSSLELQQGSVVVTMGFPEFVDAGIPGVGTSVSWQLRSEDTMLVRLVLGDQLTFFAGDIVPETVIERPATYLEPVGEWTCERRGVAHAPAAVDVQTDSGLVRMEDGERAAITIAEKAYVAWLSVAYFREAQPDVDDSEAGRRRAELFIAPTL